MKISLEIAIQKIQLEKALITGIPLIFKKLLTHPSDMLEVLIGRGLGANH